jgi:hypothetical protein
MGHAAAAVLALFAGCWRHLSGDYGPHFRPDFGTLVFYCLVTTFRTVTVLGQHLNKREPVTPPDFAMVVSGIGESIESLAARLESSRPGVPITRPSVEMPQGASADESLVFRQLTKIVTEIEAMAIEAETAAGQAA